MKNPGEMAPGTVGNPEWAVPAGVNGALGAPKWLQDVAYFDPKLAWTLLSCGRGNCIAPTGWEVVTVGVRWDSGAVNTLAIGNLPERLDTDIWVRNVDYTVRWPNAYTGSIFRNQSNYFGSLRPDIDVSVEVKSFCNYMIAQTPTPLELLTQEFNCVCPAGLVLKCNSNIRINMWNRRAWIDPDEIPTEAIIRFSGVTLPPNLYASCDLPVAVAELQSHGILPTPDERGRVAGR